jgi:hypothetical protein
MKSLMVTLGIIVLVLGIVSFFAPFPHRHHEGVKFGDAHIGVTTEHDEKIPVAAGVVLVLVGAGLIVAGSKS